MQDEEKLAQAMPDAFADRNSPRYILFQHFLSFGIKKMPSQKWEKTLQELLQKFNPIEIKETIFFIIEFILENKEWFYTDNRPAFIKGLLWSLKSFEKDTKIFSAIERIAQTSFKKDKIQGVLSTSIGKTALQILTDFASLESFKSLHFLENNIKENSFKKIISVFLEEFEQKTGVNCAVWEDRLLLELNFGIKNNLFEQKIGDFTYQLHIKSYQKFEAIWIKPNGETQQSEPAIIKKEYALELENIKDITAQIRKHLQLQRHKLEDSWRKNTSWNGKDWQNIYQNHPLFSCLVENLIWKIKSKQNKNCILYQNKLQNLEGEIITLEPNDEIWLWHPVESEVEETLAWRNFLYQKKLVQPFKQAFREVYVLTAAEQKTNTFSLRFAAHILVQKKLLALLNQRNWKFDFMENQGFLQLKNSDLKVVWEMEYASNDYFSSQKVSFFQTIGIDSKVIALANIPVIFFSEMMRDIDLFVAVCSIGSDPYWQGENRLEDYWNAFSFGEKSETASAKVRKEVLEKIVPTLKIGHLCSFEKNFLVVEGKIRTYKINIGSGNILMKPNDEYLCIVPERKKNNPMEHIFLPFDTDNLLSLILSKAFLLVDDDKTEDATILSQIKRKNKF
ncbi:MAG: DUF4132 domain-containing protein [Bacteroidetes bacterium]|nr:MAG: DUF4132 domain-containing protein [Bacteroidota bacterium]TAG89069.1 MAG: DUF4132 domain-containing protein [Bacteroidota bacterium]